MNLFSCIFTLLFFFTAISVAATPVEAPTEDRRAWQHGVDLIRVGEKLLVVWGSPGNPPRANPGGDWQHDVYYAWLDTSATQVAAPISPHILVSNPEAQEPPSVAMNTKGTILMTTEDGNGGINQHAGMWDTSLSVLRKYPIIIKRGGHSGHVAAMGDRFLIAYGEGWVDGGGWRGRGTGENVFARVVTNNGKLEREVKLTPESESNPRDSWPLVAASDRNWLVVWQRYPAMTLQAALINRRGTIVTRLQIIDGLPPRYAYDIEFAPQLDAYVVAGSSHDEGFISLINQHGEIVRTQRGLPPMAAESRIVLSKDGSQLFGVYPIKPRGIALVRLSKDKIELVKLIDNPYEWDYCGTTGIFVTPGRVLFATLSNTGLQIIPVDLGRSTEGEDALSTEYMPKK